MSVGWKPHQGLGWITSLKGQRWCPELEGGCGHGRSLIFSGSYLSVSLCVLGPLQGSSHAQRC